MGRAQYGAGEVVRAAIVPLPLVAWRRSQESDGVSSRIAIMLAARNGSWRGRNIQ